jgi:hypothetical protein
MNKKYHELRSILECIKKKTSNKKFKLRTINIMSNKLAYSAAFVFSCLMFMGCPYQSKITIDTPSVKIPSEMINTWEKESSDKNPDKFVISKDNEYVMRILKKSTSSSGEVTKYYYKGFISKVGNVEFLQVYEVEDDWSDKTTTDNDGKKVSDNGYYLYKFTHGTSFIKASLQPVTENVTETFATSAELKEFLNKYKDLSFLYDKETEKYIRTDD